MGKPSRYAYQEWHCAYCETTEDHSGSIVDENGRSHAMRCEVCGSLYRHDGTWVPDEEVTDA